MQKSLIIIGGILIAVLPWMSGGREPLAVLISVFGLTVAAFLATRGQAQAVASRPLAFLATLWLGWGALSITWSVNRFQSELWLLYALIGVLVFAVTGRLSSEHKQRLLAGYTWVATVAAGYGIYLYLTGDYNRLTTSFYWANPAAAYLVPAAFVAGWRLAQSRTWQAIIQVLVLIPAIWLTDSRGALLVVAIALVLALSKRSVRRQILPILGIIVLGFGISYGLTQLRIHAFHHNAITPGSRFSQAASGESTSGQDRLSYLKSAATMWEKHPFLGSGAGTFGTEHAKYQQRVTDAASDAHNVLAQTLAEQGLIGALILIYLALAVAWGVWRGVRREPAFAVAAAGAVAVALHFGLDIDDRYPALIALLAMLAAICYEPRRRRELRARGRMDLLMLVIVALILSISAYRSNVSYQHGQIYDDNHQLTEAAASYAAAHTGAVYDPNTFTAEGIDYYTLASVTGGSKRYLDMARDRATAAVKADPDDSQHYFLLGRVDRLAGNIAAAERNYRHALNLDRWNHPEYYLDLASLLLQKGDTVGAQKVISQAVALYPDKVISNRNASASFKPTVAELLVLQAAGQHQHGDTAAAMRTLKHALKLDKHNKDASALQRAIEAQKAAAQAQAAGAPGPAATPQ